MDYYSGGDDINQFEENGGNNFSNKSFSFSPKLVLIILAVAIVLLTFIWVMINKNKEIHYTGADDNSKLKSLKVYGGVLSPSFDSDVVKYKITANSSKVSFSCEVSSKKAKVEGCDEIINVTDKKISYNIKVIAEDESVTRYYLTIEKAEDYEDEIMDNDDDEDYDWDFPDEYYSDEEE